MSSLGGYGEGNTAFPLSTPETSISSGQKATAQGLMIVLPKPWELQLDLDSEAAFNLFKQRLEDVLGCSKYVATWKEAPSKSGPPCRHVTVALTYRDQPYRVVKLSKARRIALQFALGSDPRRESYSVRRMIRGDKTPTLFFELPKEGETPDIVTQVDERMKPLDEVA